MALVLVVMEPGSEWPDHVGDADTLVALRSERDLVSETRERLGALQRARQHVDVAVLACNGATDGPSVGRRADLAEELLSAVSRAGWGRLVLTASASASSEELRQHLLSLAGSLIGRPHGTTATVTLKFSDVPDHEHVLSSPESGSWLKRTAPPASRASLRLAV